ncbi:MAG: zinc ribbon domain-containing protein [Chloroflexi bacterium]|nr:zinc ribbon domain-containing protein [Chloroflexota bacterium]
MTVFVALLLAALAFAFVIYPFFKRKPAVALESAEDDRTRELQSKRHTAYSMLKELEFDFQSGILTTEDYQDLETRYKKKAISVLKEMDSLAKSADSAEVEDDIEKSIRKLRLSKAIPALKGTEGPARSAVVEDEIEKSIQELRRGKEGKERFCPQCGEKRRESDRFCAYCGARLKEEESS